MKRSELIRLIKERSLIYQDDNLDGYTDQQLQQIKNTLFLEVEARISEQNQKRPSPAKYRK